MTRRTIITEDSSDSRMYGPYKWSDLTDKGNTPLRLLAKISDSAIVTLNGSISSNRDPLPIPETKLQESGIKVLAFPVSYIWVGVQVSSGTVSVYLEG